LGQRCHSDRFQRQLWAMGGTLAKAPGLGQDSHRQDLARPLSARSAHHTWNDSPEQLALLTTTQWPSPTPSRRVPHTQPQSHCQLQARASGQLLREAVFPCGCIQSRALTPSSQALMRRITASQGALREGVLDDFKLLLGGGANERPSADNMERLSAACLVVNALGPKVCWAGIVSAWGGKRSTQTSCAGGLCCLR